MSKSNKQSNKKSTTQSEVAKLQNEINQLKKVTKQQKVKPKVVMETKPRQQLAKKSPTGASYNDGFDVVSPPDVRDVRVEEFDELIATLTGQIAFTLVQYAINPGNATTFPRLSRIAQLFEKYQFEKLEFYFIHDVSQYASQGQSGLVLLSVLYDAASSPPTSKTQIEACKPRVICMPNQSSLLKLNKDRMHPRGYPLFVRPGTLPGGCDIKTYDIGNFFATVQGMVGAGEVGELHVRGRVRLYDEILDASQVSPPANNSISLFQDTSNAALTTTVAKTIAFATATNNGLSVVNASGVFTPPAGDYKIQVMAGAGAAGGNFSLLEFFLFKNASADSISPHVILSGTEICMAGTWYKTCNGTDTITIKLDATFPGTAILTNCSIIFEAL